MLRKEIEYALQNVDFSNLSTDLSNRLKKINEELNANATNLNEAIIAIGYLETAIADGTITTYYQSDEPEAKIGDLWFDIANEKLYRYNGAEFDLIEDKGITEAVQAAQNAQDTADGKITSFYQNDEPTEGMSKGDLWIDTNNHNKLYRYNGILWQPANDGRIENIIDANGKIVAAEIEGIINAAIAKVQNGDGTVSFDDRGLLVHNLPTELGSTKALLISSTGILIANSKDALGNWVWRTAVTGDSISADQITTGVLKAINIQGVNISGSNMVIPFDDGGHAELGNGAIKVQHLDGSKTFIDGRGITRVFSIPIFEQQPSGTNIIDTFESGINNSRVNIASSEAFGFGYNNIAELIHTTSDDKYAGSYSLKVKIPPQKVPISILGGSGYRSNISCKFLNYRPTKDTTFNMRYKSVLPTGVTAKLYIDDLDYPDIPTQTINLTSSSWTSVSALLTKHHTYGVRVYLNYSGDSSSNINGYVYLDNMQYELNVSEDVIVGYEESLHPYYDFTYTRKGYFADTGTQQIILPDYFKGMNFDVYIMPTGDWRWNSSSSIPSMVVESINNLIPSFTVKYSEYPAKYGGLYFIYTVVLI